MSQSLRVIILDTWEAAETARDSWLDLYDKSQICQIFSHPAWCEAWWLSVKCPMALRIVLIYRGVSLVALAPLAIATRRSGPFRFRVLQFIGAPQADYCDVLVAEKSEEVYEKLHTTIKNLARSCHYIALEHIQDRSPNWPFWQGLEATRDFQWRPSPLSRALFLDLKELDYLAFSAALPKGVRYDLRRYERDLEAQGGLSLKVIPPEEAHAHFERLWEFLNDREFTTGRSVDRDSRERFEILFSNLLKADATGAHFSMLAVGGTPIAYHFGFMDDTKFYYYKPAFDSAWSKSSPGKVLLSRLVRLAAESGLAEFDFLGGDEDYKSKWSNGSRLIRDLTGFHPQLHRCFPKVWLVWIKPSLVQFRRFLTAPGSRKFQRV